MGWASAPTQYASAGWGHGTAPFKDFAVNVSAGSDVFVLCCQKGSGFTVTAPTCNFGGTFTQVGSLVYNSTYDAGVTIWRARNVTGGGKRVTCNRASGLMDGNFHIIEWPGGDSSSASDHVAAGATGTASAPDAGTSTPTQDGDLLIAVETDSASVSLVPDTGWTAGASFPSTTEAPNSSWVYQVQTTSTQRTTFFGGTATNWACLAAAFKGASGAAATSSPRFGNSPRFTTPKRRYV